MSKESLDASKITEDAALALFARMYSARFCRDDLCAMLGVLDESLPSYAVNIISKESRKQNKESNVAMMQLYEAGFNAYQDERTYHGQIIYVPVLVDMSSGETIAEYYRDCGAVRL